MAILSFDVGGSSVKFAVMEKDGAIKEKGSFTTPDNLEDFYACLAKVKNDFASKYDFEGAAFSLPGAVDNRSGIIGGASAIDYIHNFPIKEAFVEKLGMPVAMENDANCAALGEVWLGAAKGHKDVAFVVVGSGIGGAVVKDGHVHTGAHLQGGEFGYIIVGEDFKTLSETGSTGGMTAYLAELKGMEKGSINGKQAFEMLENGDEDAVKAIERMYFYLARGIYDIQYIYDPEVFLIGGAISEREDFVENIEKQIDKIFAEISIAKVRPKILRCEFGNDANLIGAVYNFLN
ncbi:MAG: ROK family protein [Selenomonadales bacterium]|nr:ROK family protein [Selenomonadales bacterium]